MEFLRQYWYIALVVVVMVLYYILYFVTYRKMQNKSKDWFVNNKDAAKVMIDLNSGIVTSSKIYILSVDGEKPIIEINKNKQVLGLLPGTHVIESKFSYTRPGVIHRNVTKTWGPSKQEVTVEANKTYNYYFDKDQERYFFEEITV